MRSVRVATALYLAVALPGLVFGWVTTVEPLGLMCEPQVGMLEPAYATTGEPCRTVDLDVLYWLVPALVLLTVGVGIAAAARAERR